MPENVEGQISQLLGLLSKIPAPIKSAMGKQIKDAEAYLKSIHRVATLPVKLEDDIAVVTLIVSKKAPPMRTSPVYDLDDLKIIMYAVIKAYNKLKPNASVKEFLHDLLGVEEPSTGTSVSTSASTSESETGASTEGEEDEA